MQNPNDHHHHLFLPDDLLLMEIFPRLPLKTVGRFRMLSRSWRTDLSTSLFTHSHLKHNSRRHKDAIVAFPNGDVDIVTIPVDDDDGTITEELDLPLPGADKLLGSCNGLVTLLVGQEDWIVVLNPITLQQERIQNTHPQVDHRYRNMRYEYGFGYDSPSDDYKIVKLCIEKSKSTSVYVYSLTSAVWRRVDDSPYNHESSFTGVFMNGTIHWLAFKDHRHYVIAAFDVATEVFREIPLPNDINNDSFNFILYGIAGCLFIIDRQYDNHDVRLMTQYGVVDSWADFSAVYSDPDNRWFTLDPPFSIVENEFVYITDWGFLVMNPTQGTINTIDDGDLDNYIEHPSNNGDTCMFVRSLVSPRP